jgi:hypothetical protein
MGKNMKKEGKYEGEGGGIEPKTIQFILVPYAEG